MSVTDDRIVLTGLRVYGFHGVYGYERRHGQDFVVDAEIEMDLSRPAATDDVTDTLHYGDLAAALAAIVGGEPVNLLETLAVRLVEACLAFPPVFAATITVHKPNAPIAEAFSDVSVRLRRARE
jgi:7,8-dihydroneopterin aldolase/epimerase/oxygenase